MNLSFHDDDLCLKELPQASFFLVFIDVCFFHQLTDIFFSFQQTPAFWEEEEVSDHLFFSSLYPPPFLSFASSYRRVFPAIEVALIRS